MSKTTEIDLKAMIHKQILQGSLGTLIFASLLSGCTTEEFVQPATNGQEGEKNISVSPPLFSPEGPHIMKGVIRVKFTPEFAEQFEGNNNVAPQSLRSAGDEATRMYLRHISAKKMTRSFPNTGRFEKVKREMGMHLWYDLTFDETEPTTRAAMHAASLKGVEEVEMIDLVAFPEEKATPFTPDLNLKAAENSSGLPFNDTHLLYQWHYDNQGRWKRHVKGSDINLFDAWKIETGKPNVVVAIVDGGVDLNHEDLKDNLYTKHHNFITNTDVILPEIHGTHIAGVVAARNNNHIGVCGIAGGNGGEGTGVKLMSCQVFSKNERGEPLQALNFGQALVWASENGAIIAQNSWGDKYPGSSKMLSSNKAGIDFFIKTAGCNEDGTQRADAPMRGGLVLFAAGNDGKDYLCYPGAYEPVVAVASIGPDNNIAYYSNRGSWVDITAPGGSLFLERGSILSTLPNNKYGYLQGTSMACPHVTGIAALIVSKYGGSGFTAEELKKRLVNSVKAENIYDRTEYKGKYGSGCIDATLALSENQHKAPEAVSAVTVESTTTSSANISFSAVKDEDNKTASNYYLYEMGEKGGKAEEVLQKEPAAIIPAHYVSYGQTVKYTISGLKPEKRYTYIIVAEDRNGMRSSSYQFSIETKGNRAPLLTPTVTLPLKLSLYEEKDFLIKVDDPEHHDWSYKVTGETTGMDYEKSKEGVQIHLKALLAVGKHSFKVVVSDRYYADTTLEVSYEVVDNK